MAFKEGAIIDLLDIIQSLVFNLKKIFRRPLPVEVGTSFID
jgi:hypothetical protein